MLMSTPPPTAHADLQQRIAQADAYLADRPGIVGYVIRDRLTGMAFRNEAAGELIWTASTIKLAMVVDLLTRETSGQIRLTTDNRQQLVDMLRSSDNDAADALWSTYGGVDNMAFNQDFPRYGMTELQPQQGYGDTYPY